MLKSMTFKEKGHAIVLTKGFKPFLLKCMFGKQLLCIVTVYCLFARCSLLLWAFFCNIMTHDNMLQDKTFPLVQGIMQQLQNAGLPFPKL